MSNWPAPLNGSPLRFTPPGCSIRCCIMPPPAPASDKWRRPLSAKWCWPLNACASRGSRLPMYRCRTGREQLRSLEQLKNFLKDFRRGNNLKTFALRLAPDMAKIWPWLANVCRIRSGVACRALGVEVLSFCVLCFGFGVWCLLFGVWCLVFGVWCLGFGVWGLGFRVQDSLGSVYQRAIHPTRCRANMVHTRQSRPDSGLGFQVKVGLGFRPWLSGKSPQTLSSNSLGLGALG